MLDHMYRNWHYMMFQLTGCRGISLRPLLLVVVKYLHQVHCKDMLLPVPIAVEHASLHWQVVCYELVAWVAVLFGLEDLV